MRWITFAAFLLLASCAYPEMELRPGSTSLAEAVRTLGPPTLELSNPDGSKQLAYSKGYYTGQTFMVYIGPEGLVRGVEQVLTEDRFYRVQAGQTRDDVLRNIGPPIETMEFPRLQQVAWDYRYQDTWGYTAILSVMIDRNGIVAGKSTRRIDRGDNKSSK